jgi:2-(3-amino-3-carboxypropyl)histidine synthase
MKVIHIHARSDAEIDLSEEQIAKLPKKLGVVTTIQHLHKTDALVEKLGAVKGGQILGCDVSNAEEIKDDVDAYLYIGSGEFHPIAVALATKKEVFTFNPYSKKMDKIKEEDVERYEKKKKASLLKFLSAEKVGILVSTKKGQANMAKALELSERKDKEYFMFAFDTLISSELENFPSIECWVNTACPRIADEKPNIINIDDVPNHN